MVLLPEEGVPGHTGRWPRQQAQTWDEVKSSLMADAQVVLCKTQARSPRRDVLLLKFPGI